MKDKSANRIKGYACLLVLIGHVMSGIRTAGLPVPEAMFIAERVLWSFHIDLFLFISGYVYALTGTWKAKGSRLRFLGLKIANLGIPYLFFSVVYILLNCAVPGANNPAVISDLWKIFYAPVAQYWYLYSLIFVFVLFVLLSRFFGHFATTAILYAAFLISRFAGIDLGILNDPLNCVLIFGIGGCIGSLNTDRLPKWCTPTVIVLHLTVGILLAYTDTIRLPLLEDAATLLGVAASVVLIGAVCKIKWVAAGLDFVCTYSFPIYLLHTIFTAAVRILLMKLGITDYGVHLAAGTVVGFAASCLIGMIAARTPYLNIVFQPVRSFEMIRKKRRGEAKAS